MTILSLSIDAQQSRDSYDECYNLTTTNQCFKTAKGKDNLLKTFDEAVAWCEQQPGYTLVKIDSTEVQSAVEKFIEEFELTSDDVWTAAKRTAQRQWTWVNGNVFSNGNFLFL